MIPAVAQTLAKILAGGTSLISTEQIDFNHPGWRKNTGPGLNLYCYDLRVNSQVQQSKQQVESSDNQSQPQLTTVNCSTTWFDVSFLVSAWDYTALGEQRLLSEALMLLLHHHDLKEELLALELRGYGNLPITVSTVHPTETAALWSALGVPLRPAVYVTMTVPFDRKYIPPSSELYFQGGVIDSDPLKAR
ncbi:MAG TPA: DUF4255 domain-containing protein [Cyanobacteria bacterium UBA8543]|nr:DUF4255 domain-containing protein [Cyanobacteria bacterium UBA8543]